MSEPFTSEELEKHMHLFFFVDGKPTNMRERLKTHDYSTPLWEIEQLKPGEEHKPGIEQIHETLYRGDEYEFARNVLWAAIDEYDPAETGKPLVLFIRRWGDIERIITVV